jgi:hypothetical protein
MRQIPKIRFQIPKSKNLLKMTLSFSSPLERSGEAKN